jgi:hypothetical protein
VGGELDVFVAPFGRRRNRIILGERGSLAGVEWYGEDVTWISEVDGGRSEAAEPPDAPRIRHGGSEMSEKQVQKAREQASALVEPGETVRHALPVTSGPLIGMVLGPLGVAFLQFRTVALTDQALYVMPQKATGGPKAVDQKMPLGSIDVSTDKNRFPLQSTLVVGDQRWNVAKPYKEEAERLAAAASAG